MALLFVASLLGPLSPNLTAFLTAQFLAGVGTGTFIPLTIGFIVRNLPQRLVVYGLAVYAMNSELSQNVSASLEGWYYGKLRPGGGSNGNIASRCRSCSPASGTERRARRSTWRCCATSTGQDSPIPGSGFSLLYAGLDQGNRLDWVNNGLVNGLLLSGSLADPRLRRAASSSSTSHSSIFGCWRGKGSCPSL